MVMAIKHKLWVSLYTPLAAIQFVSAYVILNEIRAIQRAE